MGAIVLNKPYVLSVYTKHDVIFV